MANFSVLRRFVANCHFTAFGGILRRFAAFCGVLQHLQRFLAFCNVLRRFAANWRIATDCSVLRGIAAFCGELRKYHHGVSVNLWKFSELEKLPDSN